MKYHELKVNKHKTAKRVGRGIAAGQGKTAGRGTKGQMSRTGKGKRPGFEGGQNPLMQLLPKLPGFRSARTPMQVVYTSQLDVFGDKTIDASTLAEARLIKNAYARVKLVVKGDITKKVTVRLTGASEAAIAAVQKAGGSFEKVDRLARTPSKNSKKSPRKTL